MRYPVLDAIGEDGFTALGWFVPRPGDGVPVPAGMLVLVGNAGPALWHRFAAARDPARDRLDDWTRDRLGALAGRFGAAVFFPFDTPPLPFQRWAARAGAGRPSPLGLTIHPEYGLWHAYRGALAFARAPALPARPDRPHPCDDCRDRPCLSACPVGAFDGQAYDVGACAKHIATPRGAACLTGGCLARHACPVGRAHAYRPEQAEFHMRAFLGAREDIPDQSQKD